MKKRPDTVISAMRASPGKHRARYTGGMRKAFNEIVVIYNPNSTGDSQKNAEAFADEVKKRLEGQKVTVRKTEYAGHALKIAREYAKSGQNVLIVSSSGDGGYNEVVNCIMGAAGVAKHVAAAVLPSGNANDHHNALGSDDLVGRIQAGKTERIELLKLTSKVKGKAWVRYAHSYIGFGLTPKVGRELTARKLNVFNEKWHVLYHLLKFKHVDLTAGKTVRRFSSLVFATVNRMSKVVKLASDAAKNDGLMEVYETEYRSPWQLMKVLVKASLKGLSQNDRRASYELVTITPTLVQLDGEVFTLDARADVVISCEKDALLTVL